jgi:hypothetical protein
VSGVESADLEDLQALITALAALTASTDPAVSASAVEFATQRVAIAAELKSLADQALHDAVAQARSHDVSWQQIGDVLGVSRQAAFQRFRNPDEQKGTGPMRTENTTALITDAEAVYHRLAAGDYDFVGRRMTFLVQRVLNEKKVMGVWADATAMAGDLDSLGESFLRPSGSNVVVETPLIFEGADFVGRIAYNRRNKITGMLILRPEDVPSAPF